MKCRIAFTSVILSACISFSVLGQTMVDIVPYGAGNTGSWALASSGDYFYKNQNAYEHVWEHWGNVFEIAGVEPAGRSFVGMAGWGTSSLARVGLCNNGDVFVKDQATEPGVGWSLITNMFEDAGHGVPGETVILAISSYAPTWVQVLCDNGEWYLATGDPVNTGIWEYAGNIFDMAGFEPVSARSTSFTDVKSLFVK